MGLKTWQEIRRKQTMIQVSCAGEAGLLSATYLSVHCGNLWNSLVMFGNSRFLLFKTYFKKYAWSFLIFWGTLMIV